MQKRWRIAGWATLVLIAALAFVAYRTVWGRPFTINMLANRQALEFLMRNPEVFTAVGIIDGSIFDHHSDKLAPYTLAQRDAGYAQLARFVKEVRQFDRAALSRQDQITYDILIDQYESGLAFQRFTWLPGDELYPVSPMFGVEVQLPSFMQTTAIVGNGRTARNYVKRLEAMGEKLDQVTAALEWQAQRGVVLPGPLLERSLLVIRDTVSGDAAHNALVTSFVERMNRLPSLSAAARRQLGEEAAAAVRAQVYPAYARMSAALVALRPAAAAQGAGVGRLRDGAAYYTEALKVSTTTDYTPAQVHALGLAEVERVTREMDGLLRTEGMAAGTVGERMAVLARDPRFLLGNDDAGRRQALIRYQKLLDEVSARMPEYFRTLPARRLIVERVPQSQEKGTSGAYYQQAAMDGSRPGVFFANLRDMSELATWKMNTLAYHEGIPGHHLQISTALGLKDLPLIRQLTLYSAYAEGWALYAEQLAAEIGMYRNDPWGNLGRLQAELLRAARLVVDTGIHAQSWSREQAISYMVATTGMSEAEVTSEVERYMAMPGQACAYKVGELKILQLRERAKAALGAKFSLKDFHTVILENGGMPLTLLEQLVNEWIARGGGPA